MPRNLHGRARQDPFRIIIALTSSCTWTQGQASQSDRIFVTTVIFVGHALDITTVIPADSKIAFGYRSSRSILGEVARSSTTIS